MYCNIVKTTTLEFTTEKKQNNTSEIVKKVLILVNVYRNHLLIHNTDYLL